MAEPLRVLFVGYGLHGTTFLKRLAIGLASSGVQISLATFSKRQPTWLAQHGVHRLWTPPWAGNPLMRLIRLVWLFLSRFSFRRLGWLWQQVQSVGPWPHKLQRLNRYLPFMRGDWDVIYFPWNSAATGYIGLYDFGIPVVVSCRGSQVNIRPHLPGQKAYNVALHTTLKKAAAIHCVSAHIQQSVIGMGVEPARCHIIHPAVDPNCFTPPCHPPHNQRLTLVTTGSLIWIKSYETMLSALKHLIDSGVDAELHIIGEGPERQHITFTIHDLGLADRVTLYGRLLPSEVRHQLQQADAFVLSSLSEGIANAALEAMSCGLPVITTDCGGMHEAVTNGFEGFVVPIRDSQALASALEKMATEPTLQRQMGAAGRARVLQDFSLDHQVAKFIDLFKAIS